MYLILACQASNSVSRSMPEIAEKQSHQAVKIQNCETAENDFKPMVRAIISYVKQ